MSAVLNVTAELNDAQKTFNGVVERFAAFAAIADRLGNLGDDTELPSAAVVFRLGKTDTPADATYGTEPGEVRANFAEYCSRFAVVGMITASEEFLQRVLLIAKLTRRAGEDARLTGEAFHALREETRKEVRRTSVDGLIPKIVETTGWTEGVDGEDVFRILYSARRCLLHRGGTVGPDDLHGEESLRVRWRRPVLMANGSEIATLPFEAAEGTDISVAVREVDRDWELGGKIALSARDCQEIGLTLEMLASNIVVAVNKASAAMLGENRRDGGD
jgi:hypothetical protein